MQDILNLNGEMIKFIILLFIYYHKFRGIVNYKDKINWNKLIRLFIQFCYLLII